MSLISYLKETKADFIHVSWPTKAQSIAFTAVVIIISLITAFFLGFFDYIFSKLLGIIIG